MRSDNLNHIIRNQQRTKGVSNIQSRTVTGLVAKPGTVLLLSIGATRWDHRGTPSPEIEKIAFEKEVISEGLFLGTTFRKITISILFIDFY